MEEWKLKEICELIVDCPHSTAKNEGYGYPLIRTPNVGKGRLLLQGVHRVNDEVYNARNERAVPSEGDIILAREAPVGNAAIIMPGQKVCLGQRVVLIRANKSMVNPMFLVYYLLSDEIQHRLKNNANGAVVAHLNMEEIRNLKVSIPDIKIQNSVAGILSSLDDKIECNRRINDNFPLSLLLLTCFVLWLLKLRNDNFTVKLLVKLFIKWVFYTLINDNLEHQAQALYKSWFVDFEPFKDNEFVKSELGMIPKGWSIQKAQDIFEINIGKTPPRKEKEWFTESTEDNIWVSIADMGNCGVFISDSSEYLTEKAIRKFNILMVEKDSILLSFKLTIGRVAIADAKLTTNEAIARFILPDKSYREFLYLYLKRYEYGSLGSTSSIATAVNSKTIKGMKLLMPNADIIKSFSHKARPLFEQIRIKQQESRRLSQLRDALLPRLMSGELKVNEIEMP